MDDNKMLKVHKDYLKVINIGNFSEKELELFYLLLLSFKDKNNIKSTLDFSYIRKSLGDIKKVDLIKYIKGLQKKFISVGITIDGVDDNGDEIITTKSIFTSISNNLTTDTLTVVIQDDMLYYFNSPTPYLRFYFTDIRKIKGKYGKLLVPYLMSESDKKTKSFTKDDFFTVLDINKKYKKDLSNFKKRIINPILRELEPIFINIKYTPIKNGRSIVGYTFSWDNDFKGYFNNKKSIDFKPINNIVVNKDLESIKNYWATTFIGVNFTLKHQTIIDKLLKSNSVAYVKDYLHRIWEFALTDKNVLDKQAYFSKMILDEKDIPCTVKPNVSDTIDIQKDKEQADNFMNKLGDHIPSFIQENLYDMEKRLDNLEVKKDIDTETSNLKEITQAEFDKMYFDYLKNNNRVDSIVQKVVFKGMTSNKYKIIEKKKYTIDDIPKEELLSKNGKNLSGMALKNKIEKILKK